MLVLSNMDKVATLLTLTTTNDISQATYFYSAPDCYTCTIMWNYGLQRYIMVDSLSYSQIVREAPHPWGPWTVVASDNLMGKDGTVVNGTDINMGWLFLYSKFTSADGKKMWSNTTGCYPPMSVYYRQQMRPIYLTTEPVTTYEAESATLTGTSVATSKSGYTGTGYVTGFDTTGDNCQFTVNAGTTGAYIMKIRYNTTDKQDLDVYLNGNPYETLKLAKSEQTYSSWTETWTEMPFFVWLQSGNNTIKFQFKTNNNGNLNLDKLSYALYSTTPGSLPGCYPPGPTPTPTPTPTPGGSGAFIESGGKVCFEAERATENSAYAYVTDRSSHTWSSVTGLSANAMQCSPKNGSYWTDTGTLNTVSPEMTYKMSFSTTGNYNVWLLIKAFDTESDSIHIGLDGAYKFTNTNMDYTNWTWLNVGTINSISTGYHDLSIWAREDGIEVDKIYLTTGSETPSGTGPAESSRESVEPTPTPTPTPTPGNISFATAVNIGSAEIVNNYSNYVGTKITVGGSDISVKELGRYFVSGNTGTHTLKIVNASDGTDVTGGSVSINMSTGSADALGYKYATLASPVTLSANTAYYIVSLEANGGDQWYGDTIRPTLTTTLAATVNGPAYYTGSAWSTWSASGECYVPLNFKY